MENEQDMKKIAEINAVLLDMLHTNMDFLTDGTGGYFDYDGVLDYLSQAKEQMDDTTCFPRPDNVPHEMPWSEKPADPDEQDDPYTYDGSMTPEDYDLSQAMREADQTAKTIDLESGEQMERRNKPDEIAMREQAFWKIKFFDPHGVYVCESSLFSKKYLEVQTALATIRVHAHPDELAGWDVFEWYAISEYWMPYHDENGKERRYDTGRRA